MAPRSPEQQQAISDGKRALTRIMAGPDGDDIRAWLQSFTDMAFGPEASEAQLRHANAQRALVQTMIGLKDTGQDDKEPQV